MAKKPVGTLDLPPFPPLTWDGYSWTADVVLPAWRRFQRSDGKVRLVVTTPNEDDFPTKWQDETYQYLLDHDKALADVIVTAVMAKKPWVDDDEDDDEDDEDENPRWQIEGPGELSKHLRLDTVIIHTVVREGIAYVGFQFRCEWEREHGLGVMMHRERIVAFGGADSAFLTWIAQRDAREANDP